MSSAISVTLTGVHAEERFVPREFQLTSDKPRILIGRSSTRNKIELSGSFYAHFQCAVVSRKHAEIFLSHDRVHIKDVGSLHGTAVNGSKAQKGIAVLLRSGDIVSIGTSIVDGNRKFLQVVFQVHLESIKIPASIIDLTRDGPSPQNDFSTPTGHRLKAFSTTDEAIKRPSPVKVTYTVPDSDSEVSSECSSYSNGAQGCSVAVEETGVSSDGVPSGDKRDDQAYEADECSDDDNDESEDEEGDEGGVFTPNSGGSSPPTSPLAASGDIEAQTPCELQPSAQEASVDIHAPRETDTAFFSPGDWMPAEPRCETQSWCGIKQWSDDYGVPDASSARFDESFSAWHNQEKEYHPFYPVHGLSHAPIQASVFAPAAYSPRLPFTLNQPNANNQPSCLQDVSACASKKDHPMALENIMCNEGEEARAPRGWKRKGGTQASDKQGADVSHEDAAPTQTAYPDGQTAEKTMLAEIQGQEPESEPSQHGSNMTMVGTPAQETRDEPEHEPLKKKARVEASVPAMHALSDAALQKSARTRSAQRGKDGPDIRAFAMGAAAGALAVFGALIALPDSAFF